jgi:hypothetical protein
MLLMPAFDFSRDIMQPLIAISGIPEAYIVEAIILTAGLSIILLIWLSHRKSARLYKKLERLQHDLLVANSSSIGMGQQLLALEKKLHTQANKSSIAPPKNTSNSPIQLTVVENKTINEPVDNTVDDVPDDAIYETSRQLLAQGVGIEEVIKRSGLSYSEVSLMQSLVKKG